MIASRGEHTCVSRNTRVKATRMVPSVHQTQLWSQQSGVLDGSEGEVPSGGAGKGGVSPPLLVEEGLLNGTLWRIRGNFGGV